MMPAILQISDLHILGSASSRLIGVDTTATLNAVLTQAMAERRPDALLVTGDIAHEPDEQTYASVLDVLRRFYDGPLVCLAGNHDVLARMTAAGLPMAALTLGDWWIAPWDTHEDDTPAARYDAQEFEALRAALRDIEVPHALVATHHPLIDVGCPWLDKDRLQNSTELLESLAEHSAVKSVVFGHAHQTVEAQFRHIELYGTPSTCFQFEPASQKFSIDDAAPGYRWLNLSSDGKVNTEVRRVTGLELNVDLSQRNP